MLTLILSPHCDDAPLSVGAALLEGILGERPIVKILFSVSRYTRTFPCTGPAHEITELRKAEERLAAHQGNYEAEFVGFGEPFVREGFTKMSDLFDPNRDESDDVAWPNVRAWVEKVGTMGADLILAPLSCGGHIDHRITRRAILEYNLHRPSLPIGFYEDLPYSCELSDSDILALVPRLLGYDLNDHLITNKIEAKIQMLRTYGSQLGEEDLMEVRSYWDRRGGERLWLPTARI